MNSLPEYRYLNVTGPVELDLFVSILSVIIARHEYVPIACHESRVMNIYLTGVAVPLVPEKTSWGPVAS